MGRPTAAVNEAAPAYGDLVHDHPVNHSNPIGFPTSVSDFSHFTRSLPFFLVRLTENADLGCPTGDRTHTAPIEVSTPVPEQRCDRNSKRARQAQRTRTLRSMRSPARDEGEKAPKLTTLPLGCRDLHDGIHLYSSNCGGCGHGGCALGPT